MAVMIPTIPQTFNNSEGEYQVFNALKQLDDRCYVFYSLRWINPSLQKFQKPEGEADFVVFDPRYGILVIEVKAGKIEFVHGRLIQKNRATGQEFEIDPEGQARSSKYILLRQIQNVLNPPETCAVCHAVWFPSVTVTKQNLPLNYPQDIVLDANALNTPAQSILSVYKFWAPKVPSHHLSKTGVGRVLQAIAPTFSVIPSLRASFETREQQFIQLTKRQASILDFLEEQESAVISGAAGTGKTVIALEKARRLSDRGDSVLFLCFNTALKNFLQQAHGLPRVDYQTFHGLAGKVVGDGQDKTYSQLEEDFLNWLSDGRNPWNYQHLIVDEGQDFVSEWLEWLIERTEGCRYVFYDKKQLIYRDRLAAWVENADCRLVLNKNCRNTLQISRTAYRFAGLPPGQSDEMVHGRNTCLHEISDRSQIPTLISELVGRLIQEKAVEPEEIAILTMQTEERSALARLEKVSTSPLSSLIEKGKICFTSVRKFKGLEAKVIFLIDISLENFSEQDFLNRLYIGCSRGVHELYLLLENVNQDSLKAACEAIHPGSKLKRNKKNFEHLLNAKWIEEKQYV
ncbi:MAG: ATP-dependent helicase [Elainellaceae cyanobacterium]